MDDDARETLAWIAIVIGYAMLTAWGWTQSLPDGMTLLRALTP